MVRRLPMASSLGQKRFAIDSLMSIAAGLPAYVGIVEIATSHHGNAHGTHVARH